MLNTSVIDGTNIVTATYDGSLQADQMEELRRKLTGVVAQRGSVRLLVEFGEVDLGRIEPKAIWEDLKLAGMVDDLDRYAVVADQGWVERLASGANAVTSFELKVFPTDRRDDAVAWLNG